MTITIGIVGLGYVGLPLVVEFGRHVRTIGFDIVEEKVAKCRAGVDPSREIPDVEMALAVHAEFTTDAQLLRDADFVIVAVPTPVDEARILDFGPVIGASRTIAPHLKPGAIVVYESTGGTFIKGAKVNVLALTFKENCADVRNSKIVDIIHELKSYGVEVFTHDPEADAEEAAAEYGVHLLPWEALPRADAIVAAVAHRGFLEIGAQNLSRKLVEGGSFVDVKAAFDPSTLAALGVRVWRL